MAGRNPNVGVSDEVLAGNLPAHNILNLGMGQVMTAEGEKKYLVNRQDAFKIYQKANQDQGSTAKEEPVVEEASKLHGNTKHGK